MEEVIKELSSKEFKIFLFGGGHHEIEILKKIEKKYANTISVAGRVPFSEELELISYLDIMISMDSGNAHLAAMQQIKTVTIWGVTHPFAGFAPFNQPENNGLVANRTKFPLIPTSVYGNKYPDTYTEVAGSTAPKIVIDKVKSII
jgi:ADP-heptose:LPS heptosyltransferase